MIDRQIVNRKIKLFFFSVLLLLLLLLRFLFSYDPTFNLHWNTISQNKSNESYMIDERIYVYISCNFDTNLRNDLSQYFDECVNAISNETKSANFIRVFSIKMNKMINVW